jgi:type 1 glutamine amidotransferase
MIRTLLVAVAIALAGTAAAAEPVKALFVVGGGYHDYKKLAPHLTGNMARHANVVFETLWIESPQDVEKFAAPDFAKGFEVIVYDICHADLQATPGVRAAMKLIEDGRPAVMVHCAMHSFWKDDTWAQCCGLLTRSHEAYRGFSTFRAKPEHPIAKSWPEDWKTEGDELYRNIKFPFPEKSPPSPVLMVHSGEAKQDYVVSWTHTFGKGRVFATTLGHDMKTAGQEVYPQHLAYGLLWTVGKLGDDGRPMKGYGPVK